MTALNYYYELINKDTQLGTAIQSATGKVNGVLSTVFLVLGILAILGSIYIVRKNKDQFSREHAKAKIGAVIGIFFIIISFLLK